MTNEQGAWGNYTPAQQPTAEASPTMAETFPVQTEATFEAVKETAEQFARRRDAEIQRWTDLKASLATIKDQESEARNVVTSTCFPTPSKGTQRYPLNAGWNLKLVFGWNFKLGEKGKLDDQGLTVSIATQVRELEEQIEALGDEGKLIVDRVIEWKPELKPSEYERLARSDASEIEVKAKALIDAILTVTPASPQLTLEEPKKK